MKATGMVRRIDDLGRIVIPKEIRKNLKILEGEPLEIYVNDQEEIMLRKYSTLDNNRNLTHNLTESLQRAAGEVVAVTDREKVLSVAGNGKNLLSQQEITEEFRNRLMERKVFWGKPEEMKLLAGEAQEEVEKKYRWQIAAPVLSGGDLYGSVVLLSEERKEDSLGLFVSAGAFFLGKTIE